MSVVLFVALSGSGWLLDFALFGALVAVLGLPAGIANAISATIAAMAVYVVSARLVFKAPRTGLGRTAIYFAYTEANILVWALAIEVLAGLLAGAVGGPVTAALVAKILVTPLSLLCNFLVARALAKGGGR